MRKATDVVVKNDIADPVAQEILAQSIVVVSKGMKALLGGSLNERAIVLLIQDAAGGRGTISQEDIRKVLRAAAQLEETYIKPKKKR